MECLADDPACERFLYFTYRFTPALFQQMDRDAKTEPTRARRITMAVNALAKKLLPGDDQGGERGMI